MGECFSFKIGGLPNLVAEFEDDVLLMLKFAKIPTKSVDMNKSAKSLKRQIEEYAKGKRSEFDVKLAPRGTKFREKVWRELLKIPFGQTRTYGQIAELVGGRNYARATAGAIHNNRIVIVIPCHRVIGHDGSLVGFADGIDIKRTLLEIEGAKFKE